MRQKWRLVRRYPERQAQTNNQYKVTDLSGQRDTAGRRTGAQRVPYGTTYPVRGDLNAIVPRTCPVVKGRKRHFNTNRQKLSKLNIIQHQEGIHGQNIGQPAVHPAKKGDVENKEQQNSDFL